MTKFFGALYSLHLLLAMLTASPVVSAAEANEAGLIKTATGMVAAQRANQAVTLAVGDKVFAGDRITTGANSSVGITLKDDTLISAGANATLAIEEFSFNQTTMAGGMLVSIARGAASFVTGLIGKARPQNVAIKTPTATVGIRGTEFIVEVDGSN